jgi:hypothetical protein
VCYKPSTRVWFFGTIAEASKAQAGFVRNMQHDNDNGNMQFIIEVDTINVNWFASASVKAAKAHPHGMIPTASVKFRPQASNRYDEFIVNLFIYLQPLLA